MPVTAPTMEAHRRAAFAVSRPLQDAVVRLHHLVAVPMQSESLGIIADEALAVDATARRAAVAGQLGDMLTLWTQIKTLVAQGDAALMVAGPDVQQWIADHTPAQEEPQ